jgi:predicted nucleic acid-binding protein
MVFFDTNVLVYIHDGSIPEKQQVARKLFLSHASARQAVLSTQVLQEFFVTITAKGGRLPASAAGRLIADYARLNLVTIRSRHILDAIDIHLRFPISFWDGLIVAAAKAAEASVLLTEDLSHGQIYDGVRVANPFLQPPVV